MAQTRAIAPMPAPAPAPALDPYIYSEATAFARFTTLNDAEIDTSISVSSPPITTLSALSTDIDELDEDPSPPPPTPSMENRKRVDAARNQKVRASITGEISGITNILARQHANGVCRPKGGVRWDKNRNEVLKEGQWHLRFCVFLRRMTMVY